MFENKVVVITGGANGIGKCIAEEFQKNGAQAAIIDKAPGGHFVGDIADYVSFLSDGVITLAGERRQVLSSLSYYTTQVRRITASRLTSAVSTEDLL